MIKANEIRIGNFVASGTEFNESTSNIGRVVSIGRMEWEFEQVEFEGITDQDDWCEWLFKDNFCGIPLSEEWLLKFGFEKLTSKEEGYKSTSYAYNKDFISFIVYFDGVRLSVSFWQGNEKKYVHQLQNFFHTLTGKELEIQK